MADLPNVGQMKLYDYYEPPLSAGKYKVTVRQDVSSEGVDFHPGEHVREFHVAGPRFRLGAEDVHAVYPPAQSSADYSRDLPHIVLRRRSLPWERPLDRQEDRPVPWLALLLLRPEDVAGGLPPAVRRNIRQDDGDDIEGLRKPFVWGSDLGESSRIKDAVMLPALDLDGSLTAAEIERAQESQIAVPMVTTIDVDAQLFLDIVPHIDELPFLAHVREVDTGSKELLDLPHDGYFSVVIGSRLPTPADEVSSGHHVAHLVSLEGWEDWLAGGISKPPEVNSVRLVSLVSWEFTSTPAGNDSFEALAGSLDVGPLCYTSWHGWHDVENRVDAEVVDALAEGYVPLDYNTRLGEPTVGWYRGPLLPQRKPALDFTPFDSAEAALIYDPNSGLFDVSYAVAWQLGRLLALSERHFAASQLSLLRADGRRLQDSYLERIHLMSQYTELMGLKEELTPEELTPEELKEKLKARIALLDERQIQDLFALFLYRAEGQAEVRAESGLVARINRNLLLGRRPLLEKKRTKGFIDTAPAIGRGFGNG